MKTRIERDDLGEREIPYEAYYGIQTLRSKENFEVALFSSLLGFIGI